MVLVPAGPRQAPNRRQGLRSRGRSPALAPDDLGQAVRALAEAPAAAVGRVRLCRAGRDKPWRGAMHAAGHFSRQRLHRVRQFDDLRMTVQTKLVSCVMLLATLCGCRGHVQHSQ